MLVGLAVDPELSRHDLRLMRGTGHEIDGGQSFTRRAAEALAVDGDRRPALLSGLPLKPLAAALRP